MSEEPLDAMEAFTSCSGFFVEKDEAFTLINEIISVEWKDNAKSTDSYSRLCKIMEKYQEQSNLLDPHLEDMVTAVMERVKCIISEWEAQTAAPDASEAAVSGFRFQVYHNAQLHRLFQVVYQLCRVRGHKAIVKFFPHEVSDLEPCLHLLQCQDKGDYSTWETRYVLLLWLGLLCMVPFDISTIDSGLFATSNARSSQGVADEGVTEGGEVEGGFVRCMLAQGRGHLRDAGPTRDAAALCLARLLTRPDMEQAQLARYLVWCGDMLSPSRTQQQGEGPDTFLVTGVLGCLAQLFKLGRRELLLLLLPTFFPRASQLCRVLLGEEEEEGGEGSGWGRSSSSSTQRRLAVKVCTRMALLFLPPRVVAWRYDRGNRSLLDNLATAGTAAGGGGGEEEKKTEQEEEEEEEEEEVPEQVEEVVEYLLCGLRDKDTIVRWSAAKGVGRVCARLPRSAAADVCCAVLDLFSDAEDDGAWHGGCLALAELTRRGLVLPQLLPRAGCAVVRALKYDVRRGHHSVGAHVRDAACYVSWALARAYKPTLLRPLLTTLAPALLCCSLFDREVNCRRAAAAAFQENVGRQGHENFPHGITILTSADYFSLASRPCAYLRTAHLVASLPDYRPALLQHLLHTTLLHWDAPIRQLSAVALGRLTPLQPAYMADVALPLLLLRCQSADPLARHGAVLGVAELLLALGQIPYLLLRSEVLLLLRNMVPRLEKARLYRGRGGDLVRVAVCRFIEALACSLPHPLQQQQQQQQKQQQQKQQQQQAGPLGLRLSLRLLTSVEETLNKPQPALQRAAARALQALCEHCFAHLPADSSAAASVHARVVRGPLGVLKQENAASRRGAALALGALPPQILHWPASAEPEGGGVRLRVGDEVIAALTEAALDVVDSSSSSSGGGVDWCDAETRVHAVAALASCCARLGVGRGRSGMTAAQARGVMHCLLRCCDDYARESRGDVGSWVRRAAVQALEEMSLLLVASGCAGIGSHPSSLSYTAAAAQGAEGALAAAAPGYAHAYPFATPTAARAAAAASTAAAAAAAATSGGGSNGVAAAAAASAADEAATAAAADASAAAATAAAAGPGGLGAGDPTAASAAAVVPLLLLPFRVGGGVRCGPYGCGTLVRVGAGGGVAEVRFEPPAFGAFYFPYGTGLLPLGGVRPVKEEGGVGAAAAAGEDEVDAVVAEVPAMAERSRWLLADSQQRLDELLGNSKEQQQQQQEPLLRPVLFDQEMQTRVVCCLLKQMCEKLDASRAQAGAALQRLLHTHTAALPLLPDLSMLKTLVPPPPAAAAASAAASGSKGEQSSWCCKGKEEGVVNWSSPGDVYPRLVQLLGSETYRDAALSGLVLSTGGKGEGVTKASGAALVAWAQTLKRNKDKRAIGLLLRGLLSMFTPVNHSVDYRDSSSSSSSSSSSGPWRASRAGGWADVNLVVARKQQQQLLEALEEEKQQQQQSQGTPDAAAAVTTTAAAAAAGGCSADPRIVVPLLRTLQLLLQSGAVDGGLREKEPEPPLAEAQRLQREREAAEARGETVEEAVRLKLSSEVATDLLEAVRTCVRQSVDVSRLKAATEVIASLLRAGQPLAHKCFQALAALLGHKFPKVRKHAGAQLYTALLLLEELLPDEDKYLSVLEVLSATPWDGPILAAREQRDKFCDLVGVPKPRARRPSAATAAADAAASEKKEESYEALVRETGY